jgi:hypothetical protein
MLVQNHTKVVSNCFLLRLKAESSASTILNTQSLQTPPHLKRIVAVKTARVCVSEEDYYLYKAPSLSALHVLSSRSCMKFHSSAPQLFWRCVLTCLLTPRRYLFNSVRQVYGISLLFV